jgi:hypothetical protein
MKSLLSFPPGPRYHGFRYSRTCNNSIASDLAYKEEIQGNSITQNDLGRELTQS